LAAICTFIVKIYVKAWFAAPSASKALRVDFNFMKNVKSYAEFDAEISKEILHKFSKHLWYFAPETTAFSFFDENLAVERKEEMRQAFLAVEGQNEESDEESVDEKEEEQPTYKRFHKRYRIEKGLPNHLNEVLEKNLDQFVRPRTRHFFSRFNIGTDFLRKEVAEWANDPQYQFGRDIVAKLRVTNDIAERAVKLIQDYNKSRTKSEEQQQYLIQVVNDYRKTYPDYKKSTLTQA